MTDTVLLIDDNTTLLESLTDFLRLSGYSVVTAENGDEGLDQLEKTVPDIIICDIMMPEMDGYQFFNEVRKNSDWVAIPFIFLTAKGEKQNILDGYALGADHYITKPFDPEELLLLVRAHLRRSEELQKIMRRQVERYERPLAHSLAPDLRAPIELVQHYLDVYQKERENLAPERAEQISIVMSETLDRMVSLFEDLMLIVYIESGAVKVELQRLYQPLDLSQILIEIIDHLSPRAERSEVSLVPFLPPELPVSGHAHFTRDIFQRIIENAIKFSQPGGNIWIEAKSMQEGVSVSIRDEGMGISKEEQARIFSRSDDPGRVKIEKQGGGWGLVIAARLVRLHGGEIQVESVIGKGSTFKIWLPVSLGES